jgi:hypothetical protein
LTKHQPTESEADALHGYATLEKYVTNVETVQCPKHGEHSIELDCAPGGIRPWHLIEGVLADTGLEKDVDTSPGAFFGMRAWVFKVTCDKWDEVQKVTKPRITALYNSGTIRYGSW